MIITNSQEKGLELIEKFPGLYQTLREPKFSFDELDIDKNLFAQWKHEGLFFEVGNRKRGRLYSVTELLWVRLLQKARSLNIPRKDIAELSSFLDKPVGFNDKAKRAEIEKVIRQQLEAQGFGSAHLSSLLKGIDFDDALAEHLGRLWDLFVFDALLMERHYELAWSPDYGWELSVIGPHEDLIASTSGKPIYYSRVVLSFSELVSEFVFFDPVSFTETFQSFLSEKEQKLISLLRPGGWKSIEVKARTDQKWQVLIESTSSQLDTGKRLYELLSSNGYEQLRIKTVNGKVQIVENTISHLFG